MRSTTSKIVQGKKFKGDKKCVLLTCDRTPLRSRRPTMRQAMSEAKVGDDVFGEDPTVNRLEEMVAKRLGKEAALFVASGTMANLVSQLTHCGRGNEMILGDQSHMFVYEQGGSAALGGIHPRTLENQPDGKMAIDDIEAAIRSDNVHFPGHG